MKCCQTIQCSLIMILLTAIGLQSAEIPSSEEGLKRLVEGNKRYVNNAMTRPDQSVERRSELVKGQQPFAIILSCSDSRVPPEILFDQGIGNLFVIRTAGNVFDNIALGSIEYAAEHLKVPLLVVLGHEKCGAVTATVEGGHAPGHIFSIVEAIHPSVEKAKSRSGDVIDGAVRINAIMCAERLQASEPILSELVKSGKLKIVPARYNLSTGEVEFLK